MFKSRKGSSHTPSFSNQSKNAGGISNRLFNVDFTHNYNRNQCKKCPSDDLRFAIDGFCLRCQQRAEFIIREYPHILAKAGGSTHV